MIHKIIITIMLLVAGFTSVNAQIALTPRGAAAFPDSLWGKPVIIEPGEMQTGCGPDGCGWERLTVKIKPFAFDTTPPPPPPTPKPPVIDIKEDTLCHGDSLTIRGVCYKQPGYVKWVSNDTTFIRLFGFRPPVTTNKDTTITEGQKVLFAKVWRDTSGIFSDTLETVNGCDSIVTLRLTVVPVCKVCDEERTKWEQAGRIAVSLPVLREENNDWQNKTLHGLGLSYEYKFLDGLIFDPKKKPCIGESAVAYLGIRSVNAEPPSSDCLTCDNLPKNASTGIEGRLQYKIAALKGIPIVPSIAGGVGFLYNQGARDQFKVGIVITPEVEWILFNKENLPAVSVFSQTNIAIGKLPSDWRVGVRLTIGGR